jgi:hypothetical protein
MHHERNITCKILWSYQQLHVDIHLQMLFSYFNFDSKSKLVKIDN